MRDVPMSRSPRHVLSAFAVFIFALAATHASRAADIAGAMTGDYLAQCQSSQTACRDFTNDMLKAVTASPSLGNGKTYRVCAPLPLGLPETGQLLQRILSRPQEATGNAAEDIATAAQALWPCK
jgi:hypothetical protein